MGPVRALGSLRAETDERAETRTRRLMKIWEENSCACLCGILESGLYFEPQPLGAPQRNSMVTRTMSEHKNHHGSTALRDQKLSADQHGETRL